MIVKGHMINPGYAEGEAVVTTVPFSFLGDFDPLTGKIQAPSHELYGQSLVDKILVCPAGKGSSAGPIVTWRAKKSHTSPKAIICGKADPIMAAAAITADIPMMDNLDQNPIEVIKTGDYLKVDAQKGIVEILAKNKV